MTIKSLKLSIIVPVRNEENSLLELCEEFKNLFFKNYNEFEIIFINDNSSDNTKNIINKFINETNFIKIHNLEKHSGQSECIDFGIKNSKYDLIATIDGDGQNPPSEIINLYNNFIKINSDNVSCHMIIGLRISRKDNFSKKIGSIFANFVRNLILGDNCKDSGSGIKIFYKSCYLSLPFFRNMHRFMPALMIRENFKVMSQNVEHRKRLNDKSKYNNFNRFFVGIIDLIGVYWLIRRKRKN